MGRDMVFDILIFSVTFWLGLHLVSREPRSPRLLLAGSGLVSYALGWACIILSSYVSTPTTALMIANICWILFTVLAPLLVGTSIFVLPEEVPTINVRRILLVLLFFAALGLSLLSFPQMWLQRSWILRLVGLDIIVIGATITALYVFEEGEAMLPDL